MTKEGIVGGRRAPGRRRGRLSANQFGSRAAPARPTGGTVQARRPGLSAAAFRDLLTASRIDQFASMSRRPMFLIVGGGRDAAASSPWPVAAGVAESPAQRRPGMQPMAWRRNPSKKPSSISRHTAVRYAAPRPPASVAHGTASAAAQAGEVGQADGADLAGPPGRLDRRPGLLDGGQPVRAVQVPEVDVVGAEPAQAVLDLREHRGSRQAGRGSAGGRRVRPALGRKHDR